MYITFFGGGGGGGGGGWQAGIAVANDEYPALICAIACLPDDRLIAQIYGRQFVTDIVPIKY